MGNQVTGDADDVRTPLDHPGRGLYTCPVPAGERRAEMEVGEMCDAKAVEPEGQSLDLHVEHAGAQPAGFEPSVDEARDGQTHDDGRGTSIPGD